MQYANSIFAMFLLFLLVACNTSQSSKTSQKKNSTTQSNTLKITNQETVSSTIPDDGKLRDEHLRMYVSVKIKQEQLRYQQKILQSTTSKQADSKFRTYTDNDLETIAVNEFGFDSEIYSWSKRIIQDTLSVYAGSEPVVDNNSLQSDKDVVTHNLLVLAKHRDELRFANSYKLKLNISSDQQRAVEKIRKYEPADSPKPST